MKKTKLVSLGLAGAMALGVAGCGTTANTDSGSVADSSSAASAASSSEAAPSSAATADNAALSGTVTVYMPSPAGLADKLAEGFEAKTGVKVEQFQGTTGEILARMEAESANPVADVVILASWSDGLSLKADGMVESYTPANADKMNAGWVDSDKMLYGTSASAVGVIYNTTVFPTLDADWADLADAQYKDQLAIPDPEKSGACKDFLAGYITANGEDSWSTWQALADNGMTVPGANKAALEAVTTGEKGILIAGVDYNAYSSMAKGEPLNIYYPKSGTVVNPRPAMIMKTSQNMDNAKAFMDYLLSDEGQKLVADAYLLPGRSDVTCENRSNLADIPQIKTDWDTMMKSSDEIAAKLNELCA